MSDEWDSLQYIVGRASMRPRFSEYARGTRFAKRTGKRWLNSEYEVSIADEFPWSLRI